MGQDTRPVTPAPRPRRDWLRLCAVVLIWLLAARLLATHAAPLLPRALARQLGLHSFLSLVLIVSTALGIVLAFVLLARPRDDLGLRRPSGRTTAMAALWAPVVLALSLYAGFQLALPTLLEELAQGGREAAQRNTGAFGRAIAQSHWLTTMLWATVLTPLAEELIFRGGLWSAVARLTRGYADRPRSLPPELLTRGFGARAWRWLLTGGLATVVSTVVFAWLHADQSGGAGIIRVVQAACLGLALGLARHASGSVVPGMLLHAIFNGLSIVKLRKWIVTDSWPHPLPIPIWYWVLALAALTGLALWWAITRFKQPSRAY